MHDGRKHWWDRDVQGLRDLAERIAREGENPMLWTLLRNRLRFLHVADTNTRTLVFSVLQSASASRLQEITGERSCLVPAVRMLRDRGDRDACVDFGRWSAFLDSGCDIQRRAIKTATCQQIAWCMDTTATEIRDALPPLITVYRGSPKEFSACGLFWSPIRDYAMMYTKRSHKDKRPYVLATGIVDRSLALVRSGTELVSAHVRVRRVQVAG